jgi:peroxiredoxin
MRWTVLLLAVACAPHLETSDGSGGPWSWDAPQNRWAMGEPEQGTRGQGFAVGQVVPDVRMPDQFGEEVSLWQFSGQVLLFDVSTMWCAPCQELAQGTQASIEYYADDPFTYLTILQENVESQPPEHEDLIRWADTFGIAGPVTADGDKQTARAVIQGQYPAVLVIGPDLTVLERVNPPNDEEVHNAVDRALASLE